MSEKYPHDPVLCEEVMECLSLGKGSVIVDGTLGLGGHSKEILERIGSSGKLIGFDCDGEHIEIAKERLAEYENTIFIRSNFAHLKSELLTRGIESVDGVLLDLGIASTHVDVAERGFSFREDGPLDMRLDDRIEVSAKDIVNTWFQEDLAKIFYEYGEERNSHKIARAIVEAREEEEIKGTARLAEIVLSVVHKKERLHPATRVFQALRIAVNDELGVLMEALNGAMEVLKSGGRLVVISYHSLEDRIVKRAFKDASTPETKSTLYSANEVVAPAEFKLITRKPIVPTEEEVERNKRSRSAKMRVVEKI